MKNSKFKIDELIKIGDLALELDCTVIEIMKIRKKIGVVTRATVLDRNEAEKVRDKYYNPRSVEIIKAEEETGFFSDIRVTKLTIRNFKSYEKLIFCCDSTFNMVVGENNIGKSTIYDAFLLWEIAYKKLITSNSTFYRASTMHKITTLDLVPFRIIDIGDIFKDSDESCFLEMVFTSNDYDLKFNLGIEFIKPNDHDSYILANIKQTYRQFEDFYTYLKKLKVNIRDAFSITLIRPISNIVRYEIFYNNAQIHNKSNTGYSFETLRNKILETRKFRKFEYIEKKLYGVLGKRFKIRWKNLNRDIDVNVQLTIQEENEKEVDISLVGSGVLNLLEIFSALFNKTSGANLLLLDEPDSHIHSDIQPKLINELRKTSNSSQVFVITHNDRLILTVSDDELFYLCKKSKNSHILKPYSLNSDNVFLLRKQMAGSIYKLELDYKNKPVLFVEGVTDKNIIEAVINKSFNDLKNKIDIRYKNGHNWVKDQILSWSYGKLPNRSAGLFDYDADASSSIKEVNSKISNGKKRNFKLFSLKNYAPLHIRKYYDHKVYISYSIEEMFADDIWMDFMKLGFLKPKNDFFEYNKSLDFSKSVKQYCEEKGIAENQQLYLYKVKHEKKEVACDHIVSKIYNTNTDAIESVVMDILAYLLDFNVDNYHKIPPQNSGTSDVATLKEEEYIKKPHKAEINHTNEKQVSVSCPYCSSVNSYHIRSKIGSSSLPKCNSCGEDFHLNMRKNGCYVHVKSNIKTPRQKPEIVQCPFCTTENNILLGISISSTRWCTCIKCEKKFPVHRKKSGKVFVNPINLSKV